MSRTSFEQVSNGRAKGSVDGVTPSRKIAVPEMPFDVGAGARPWSLACFSLASSENVTLRGTDRVSAASCLQRGDTKPEKRFGVRRLDAAFLFKRGGYTLETHHLFSRTRVFPARNACAALSKQRCTHDLLREKSGVKPPHSKRCSFPFAAGQTPAAGKGARRHGAAQPAAGAERSRLRRRIGGWRNRGCRR